MLHVSGSGLGSEAAAAPIRVMKEPRVGEGLLRWFEGHRGGLAGEAASDWDCGLLRVGRRWLFSLLRRNQLLV